MIREPRLDLFPHCGDISLRAFQLRHPGLAIYKLDGFEETFFHPRLRTNYVPNLNEWLVSLWIVSLGLLAFLLGTPWLPVLSPEKEGSEHAI